MPVIMIWRNCSDNKPSPIYQPLHYLSPDLDRLKAMRARYSRDREDFLALQKQAHDREYARFFKEEANWCLKLWRAADVWVKWIEGSKDWRPPSQWPCELGAAFDFVQSLAAD